MTLLQKKKQLQKDFFTSLEALTLEELNVLKDIYRERKKSLELRRLKIFDTFYAGGVDNRIDIFTVDDCIIGDLVNKHLDEVKTAGNSITLMIEQRERSIKTE